MGGYVVPHGVPMSRLAGWLFGIGKGHPCPATLLGWRSHHSNARRMPRPMPAPAQGRRAAAPPCPSAARLHTRGAVKTSISFLKRSSTGWGRYSYSPSPQTGRPCRALRSTQFLLGIPKWNLALPAILTGRLCLPIILADLSKYGGICHRHQTSSVVSWRLRLIALSLPRRLAFRRGLPGNTTRRTRVGSWRRLCGTCRGMTHNARSGV